MIRSLGGALLNNDMFNTHDATQLVSRDHHLVTDIAKISSKHCPRNEVSSKGEIATWWSSLRQIRLKKALKVVSFRTGLISSTYFFQNLWKIDTTINVYVLVNRLNTSMKLMGCATCLVQNFNIKCHIQTNDRNIMCYLTILSSLHYVFFIFTHWHFFIAAGVFVKACYRNGQVFSIHIKTCKMFESSFHDPVFKQMKAKRANNLFFNFVQKPFENPNPLRSSTGHIQFDMWTKYLAIYSDCITICWISIRKMALVFSFLL